MDPLAEGRGQTIERLHANMQIPKVIGAARLYELTGRPEGEKVAEVFWHEVVEHHTYVNGGNSDREVFGKRDEIAKRMSGSMTETCNTYNMLKLTRHLFEWNPEAQYFDYYERALYNQILTSQDPKTGLSGYKLGLYGGYFQPFSTLEDSFWCCTGTGMENHAKYGDTIYFHDEGSLFVNLFIPSELSWDEKGLRVTQETSFPESDTTRLTLHLKQPVRIAMKIRYPAWATGFEISVNGQAQPVQGTAGSYVSIEREWQDGDQIDVHIPMNLHLESLPSSTDMVAVLYGPIVLAGALGTEDMPDVYNKDYHTRTALINRFPTPAVPVRSSLATHMCAASIFLCCRHCCRPRTRFRAISLPTKCCRLCRLCSTMVKRPCLR